MEFQIAVEPGDFSLVGNMGTQLSISSKTDVKEVRAPTAQLVDVQIPEIALSYALRTM